MNKQHSNIVEDVGQALSAVQAACSIPCVDEFQLRALRSLSDRLSQIRQECKSGHPTPCAEREGEMARLVVESDPDVLTPQVGGQIIAIEKAYYALG